MPLLASPCATPLMAAPQHKLAPVQRLDRHLRIAHARRHGHGAWLCFQDCICRVHITSVPDCFVYNIAGSGVAAQPLPAPAGPASRRPNPIHHLHPQRAVTPRRLRNHCGSPAKPPPRCTPDPVQARNRRATGWPSRKHRLPISNSPVCGQAALQEPRLRAGISLQVH